MAITALTNPGGHTNTTASTTLNLPYPTGILAGDYLVLFASVNSTTAATLPTGWTSVFSGNSSGSNPSILLCIKQATGLESGSVNLTTPSAKSTGGIIGFRGVDTTTPQDVAAQNVAPASGSGNVTFTGITTTRTGCALIYAAAHGNGAETATPPNAPALFTETDDNTGTGGWSGTMGYLIWSGSGATGTVTVSFTGTTNGLGVLMALRPASAGGPTNPGAFLMFAN